MDLVFSVNSDTEDLRYGDPTTGALENIVQLGFNCTRFAVLPDERYVYVSGSKQVGAEIHAWVAVVDTCANVVGHEFSLGEGFAGQIAVPPAIGGTRAYVAVSKAVTNTVTGGSNRIEVLNITDPTNPMPLRPAYIIPGSSPYGTLHIVWSTQHNKLYTSHRASGSLYSIDPRAAAAQFETTVSQEPTGLALSRNGDTLYIGRRAAGDIVPYDISRPQIGVGSPIPLPQGRSKAAIYLAVDAFDRIVATSAQRPNTPSDPNPNPNPTPGLVYIVDPTAPGTPKVVDTQGTWLGQPAPRLDGTRVFVPRGDQNDIVEIDPAPNPPTMAGSTIAVGHSPTDVVVLDHTAVRTLEATPAMLQGTCDADQHITINAFDACHNEVSGIPISWLTFGNVMISPSLRTTPARFTVRCVQGGIFPIIFSANAITPAISLTVDANCQCPVPYCLSFVNPGQTPIAPTTLGGIITVEVRDPGVGAGPQIFGDTLRLHGATLRFYMPAGITVANLAIFFTRNDPFDPREMLTIGTDRNPPTYFSMIGYTRGDGEVSCMDLHEISIWTFTGGTETIVHQICFDGQADLPFT